MTEDNLIHDHPGSGRALLKKHEDRRHHAPNDGRAPPYQGKVSTRASEPVPFLCKALWHPITSKARPSGGLRSVTKAGKRAVTAISPGTPPDGATLGTRDPRGRDPPRQRSRPAPSGTAKAPGRAFHRAGPPTPSGSALQRPEAAQGTRRTRGAAPAHGFRKLMPDVPS